jgi:hypothetical protein
VHRGTGVPECSGRGAKTAAGGGCRHVDRGSGDAGSTIPAMDVYLETERLVLRRFTPDDVDLVTELGR